MPLPVLVLFHGGGWVVRDLATHDGIARSLASAAGCAVVSVDDRLAPEWRYPVAAEDAHAATRWVAERAPALGLDARRIAVGADSAGGTLATVVALMARDRGGPPLVFQLLVYPVTRHTLDTPPCREHAEGHLLTREAMRWFWGHCLRGPEDGREPHASLLDAPGLAGLPPALRRAFT